MSEAGLSSSMTQPDRSDSKLTRQLLRTIVRSLAEQRPPPTSFNSTRLLCRHSCFFISPRIPRVSQRRVEFWHGGSLFLSPKPLVAIVEMPRSELPRTTPCMMKAKHAECLITKSVIRNNTRPKMYALIPLISYLYCHEYFLSYPKPRERIEMPLYDPGPNARAPLQT